MLAIEIVSLFDGIVFSLLLSEARFEELEHGIFLKFDGSRGEVLSDSRIDERNVHDVVLVGGSTRIKFLATETFHGVGGHAFDAHGNRFADELGRPDYVTGEMWKNKPPFCLAINKVTLTKLRGTANTGRGVMKFSSLVQLWPWKWESLSRRWRNQSKLAFRLP